MDFKKGKGIKVLFFNRRIETLLQRGRAMLCCREVEDGVRNKDLIAH